MRDNDAPDRDEVSAMPSLRSGTGAPGLRSFLSALLQSVRQQTGIPGLAIAVRTAGPTIVVSTGLAAAHDSVPLMPRARFQIGCVVKMLTAVVVAQLVRKGVLDIEAPVEYYLTELSRIAHGGTIRVKHLLAHTSGYAGPGDSAGRYFGDPTVPRDASWTRFVEFFRHTPQLFEPGTIFSYEHTEHVLLGEIVRRLSQQDIIDHYRERILEPLGIHTGLPAKDPVEVAVAEHQFCRSTRQWTVLEDIEHNGFWRATFSDWTVSVGDLCQLGRILLPGPDAALGGQTATFLANPVVTLPVAIGGGIETELVPRSFGLGCALYHGGLLGHNSAVRGQVCGLRADPVSRMTVGVAISAYQPILRDRLLEHVIEHFIDARMPTGGAEEIMVDPATLVGRYIGPLDTQIIVQQTPTQLLAEIVTAGSDVRLCIPFKIGREGRIVRSSDFPLIPISFFHDPHTARAGLMLGLKAFRQDPE